MTSLPKDFASRLRRPAAIKEQMAATKTELRPAKRSDIRESSNSTTNAVFVEPQRENRELAPVKPVASKLSSLPKRPVLAATPVVVNPDAEESRLVVGRGRTPWCVDHANEWMVITAHTLAMRCSRQPNGYILTEDELFLLAESIRKSTLASMAKGKTPLITKIPESLSRAAYRLTTTGESCANSKFPTGKQNADERLNKSTFDLGEALNLSTVAAGLSVPSEPGSWGEGNSGLEPALPVISRYRIAASADRKFTSAADALAAQRNHLERWVRIAEEDGGIPVANTNWHLGLMDDEMFAKVHKALLTPIPAQRQVTGQTVINGVWPAGLFETYDKNGQPEGLIDGVIGAPWIIEQDPRTGEVFYNSGFSAIVTELHGQTDERTAYVLWKAYTAQVGFRSLFVFPSHNTIGETFKRVWSDLIASGHVKPQHKDWLHIAYYSPLNSGREEFAPAIAPALSRGEKKNYGAG